MFSVQFGIHIFVTPYSVHLVLSSFPAPTDTDMTALRAVVGFSRDRTQKQLIVSVLNLEQR